MFCSLTDAFTLRNCSVTFWLMEAWQLLITALVLGNAFRCFYSCYHVEQELRKKKTIQQISWREIWKTVKLQCTLICAVTGTPVGVLYCSMNERWLLVCVSLNVVGQFFINSVCLPEQCLLPQHPLTLETCPTFRTSFAFLPDFPFFHSSSPPLSLLGSLYVGQRWAVNGVFSRHWTGLASPPIDILPTSFSTSISTVTFSHPLHHFSAWLAFHLWICMAG